jgi:hypothetical protein
MDEQHCRQALHGRGLYPGWAGGKAGAMTTRTRSLLDLLLALVLFASLAGIYLAASHAIEWHVKATVDAVQERQQ